MGVLNKKNKVVNSKLAKKAKIEKLPKNVRESIPFNGMMSNGIVETYHGTFTKSYELKDVNFQIAPPDEQASIYSSFMEFLNSFSETTKWQFNIFNHKVAKRKTLENIRVLPQRDGLNLYRQELNKVLLDNLTRGNNSIEQSKYLTVAINDENVEHAASTLKRIDADVAAHIRKISKADTSPMSTMQRMLLLYNIYNQDSDYRFSTGVFEKEDEMSLSCIEKQGLSIKDVVGPAGINYAPRDYFQFGDTYGRVFYLERVPKFLKTTFLSDISDIQSNMLISITSETTTQEEAVKLVKGRLAEIEGQVSDKTKKHIEEGYFGANISPELAAAQKNARELMEDITSRNQRVFYISLCVCVFADTKDQLEEVSKQVKSVAGRHLCPLKPVYDQQEFAINTCLPLCRNDMFVDRMYTTESAAVFIPYNSQEINQKNAIFYGLNQSTNSMILCDRLSGDNFNGLIFGSSGSGKSFMAKYEIASVILTRPDSQVFIIDPQGEYSKLADGLNGTRITIAPGNNVFLNPLDLDLSSDEQMEIDPISMKSDSILSMLEIMMGKNRQIEPSCRSIIDRCVRKIYRAYINDIANRTDGVTIDVTKCPTLTDLYQELRMQQNVYADQLADVLELYAIGSFNTFAHRTNVKTDARLVVYDTMRLGTGMMELGLHICINDIWNRMIANMRKGIYTWFYIDEFHVLLRSQATTVFLKQVWKMARKWLGVPTGIMQNTEDLLRDSGTGAAADTRAIINNTSFVIMMKSSLMDRQNLAELFHLSEAQLEKITECERGTGLLYNGKVTLPFSNKDFPKNTKLFDMFSTSKEESQKEGVA